VFSATTYLLTATFDTLTPDSTYYAEVRAVNHSGIDTDYLQLGSTKTRTSNAPTNLQFTAASTNTLTATWTASDPAGNTYTLRVSTDGNFSVINGSSNTALTAATIESLEVNTTYYGQVNSILNGGASAWTSYVTTATLASVPVSYSSTWTAVNISSLTVRWDKGTNPSDVTQYVVK